MGRLVGQGSLNSGPLAFPQSHEGVCPQESVYCENKCGARMMRRLLAQHATSECPKRTQPCTYCTKEFVFDTIQVRPFLNWGLGQVAGSQATDRCLCGPRATSTSARGCLCPAPTSVAWAPWLERTCRAI